MIFVTNDSFSELVWSPRKGLSIRCAVGSVDEIKSSFFWGVGPGDMVLSPPHTIGTETNHENFAEERISIPPPTTSKNDANEAVDQSIALRSSDGNMPTFQSGPQRKSGSCESINTSSRINYIHVEAARLYSTREGDVSNQGNTFAVDEGIQSSSPVLEDRMPSNVLPDSDDRVGHAGLVGDKLECVAENDLLPSDNFVPDSVVDARKSLQGGKEHFQLEVCEISKASPIRALASERKGKEKALSGDYINKGASQEDDGSYESVESCNSARQVSARKKRVLSFEEQLIDGSKRLKMQIRETPGSSSFTRSNSSFSNWISTIIKGLSRPDEDGEPSLAHPSTGNVKKALGTSSREQDNACANMGFQSLFQSIYRPNSKVQDERLLCSDNYQRTVGCKELKVTENSGESNTNQVISSPDDLLALKDNSSKSLNQSVPGAAQDPLLHSTGLKGSVTCYPLDSKTDASSKQFCINPDSTATRDERNSQNFIAGKRATDSFGRSCSNLQSMEKLLHTPVKKDDHFSGLFINHFFPKSSRFVTNTARHKQVPAETVECAAASPRPLHNSQRHIGCLVDSANVELQGSSSQEPTNSSFKKLHNFPLDVEASSVKPIKAQNINQMVHFQRFSSSEAMASIFAKRLDALKNILPSDLTHKATSSATTCFFCGIVGHDLRYCPQVTESEVDELLRNLPAYGGKEESPCLCIRCFQLNHWAAACPNALSQNKNKAEDDADVLRISSGEFLQQQKFVTNLSLPDSIDGQPQGLRVMTGRSSSPRCYKPSGVGTSIYMNLDMKEDAESVAKVSSNLQNINAARSEENAADLPGFTYPCGSLATYAFTMPKEIFEAVKSLQLSRTNIMKWMNSIFSTSLDGFYLRLRRKLGEGPGGTQYHVACICSPQQGKSAETSKRPIYVIVDGSKCLVESQYISNQDFLEDELKAWWSATLRGDRKIPSEDELRSKVEERKRLGL